MKFRFIPMVAAVLVAMPAFALDLHAARAQGLVGEKLDGYVTALKPSADVNSLVSKVNAERRAEYSKISKKNGQPIDVVGKLAAPQILQHIESGAQYQDASGNWQTR